MKILVTAKRVPDPEQDVSLSVPPPVSAGGSCATDVACRGYVDALHATVLSHWSPREASDRVRVQLFVSESGCPYDARVLEASSRASAIAALDALSRSRPVPALPPDLASLRYQKIVLTFTPQAPK